MVNVKSNSSCFSLLPKFLIMHSHCLGNTKKPLQMMRLKLQPSYKSIRASQVGLVIKNPPANAGDLRDTGSIPWSGRSPGGGHGNPLSYSCLENLMERGALWAKVHVVAKGWTLLKQLKSNIKKQRHYFANKGPFSQGYGFFQ